MNMKNATILLLFALSILGLVVGVYVTDDAGSGGSDDSTWQRIYEDNGGIFNVQLIKKEINNLSEIVT